MVETGSRRSLLGPAAIAVLLLLVVAGVVADGSRGDAGHPFPAAAGGEDLRRLDAGLCHVRDRIAEETP